MAQSLQDNTRNVPPLPSSPQHLISITLERPNSSSSACFCLWWEGTNNLVVSSRLPHNK